MEGTPLELATTGLSRRTDAWIWRLVATGATGASLANLAAYVAGQQAACAG